MEAQEPLHCLPACTLEISAYPRCSAMPSQQQLHLCSADFKGLPATQQPTSERGCKPPQTKQLSTHHIQGRHAHYLGGVVDTLLFHDLGCNGDCGVDRVCHQLDHRLQFEVQ